MDYNELNYYLQGKLNIPAFQHRIFYLFFKYLLEMLKSLSFNLKFSSFITYVASNIKSIFSSFRTLNSFSNFNFDINIVRIYKSDSE